MMMMMMMMMMLIQNKTAHFNLSFSSYWLSKDKRFKETNHCKQNIIIYTAVLNAIEYYIAHWWNIETKCFVGFHHYFVQGRPFWNIPIKISCLSRPPRLPVRRLIRTKSLSLDIQWSASLIRLQPVHFLTISIKIWRFLSTIQLVQVIMVGKGAQIMEM